MTDRVSQFFRSCEIIGVPDFKFVRHQFLAAKFAKMTKEKMAAQIPNKVQQAIIKQKKTGESLCATEYRKDTMHRLVRIPSVTLIAP